MNLLLSNKNTYVYGIHINTSGRLTAPLAFCPSFTFSLITGFAALKTQQVQRILSIRYFYIFSWYYYITHSVCAFSLLCTAPLVFLFANFPLRLRTFFFTFRLSLFIFVLFCFLFGFSSSCSIFFPAKETFRSQLFAKYFFLILELDAELANYFLRKKSLLYLPPFGIAPL